MKKDNEEMLNWVYLLLILPLTPIIVILFVFIAFFEAVRSHPIYMMIVILLVLFIFDVLPM